MKYKRLALLTLIPLALIAILGQGYVLPSPRYHQHLQAPAAKPCTDHGPEKFCTHLPLISIVTDSEMPDPIQRDSQGRVLLDENRNTVFNNQMVAATVEVFDRPGRNNHLEDSPAISARAYTRYRGNTSRTFDKGNFLLHFRNDDMKKDRKVPLCGMAKDNSWVLHGPFADRSLIRNYLCMNLAGEMMDYAPNVRFCEVFLNGDYRGLYLAMEKISRGTVSRVQIPKSDPGQVQTPFILQLDRGRADALHRIYPFSQYTGNGGGADVHYGQFEITYPGDSLTPEQRQYIENQVSRMEHSLYSFDYRDPRLGYYQYLDVRSFVNYYLLNEFTANYDAMAYSTYVYRDVGGKFTLVPWDFDLSFMDLLGSFNEHTSLWYKRLLKDPWFVEQIIDRYQVLRSGVLSEEALCRYVDDTAAYLGPAMDRDWERWGRQANSFQFSQVFDHDIPHTREESMDQLKQAICLRGQFMDDHIEMLRMLCHDSLNKKYNYQKGRRFP